MQPTVTANTRFAFDLFARLSADDPTANLFFSPYSVSMALVIVAEGARRETAEQMGRVLRFPDSVRNAAADAPSRPWYLAPIHTDLAALNERLTGADRPDPTPLRARIETLRQQLDASNREVKKLERTREWERGMDAQRKSHELALELNRLLSQVDPYELRVANALWGEKTYPFRQSYIDTVGKYYKTGGIFALDFSGNYGPSIDRINAWVEEQTHRRITNLIPKDALSADARGWLRLVVTNAVYFRGQWAEPFPASQTEDDDFSLAVGGKVKVPMMHHDSLDKARYGAFNADGSFFDTPRETPWEDRKSTQQPPQYPASGGFAILELFYKGGDLSIVILVPRAADSLPALEKKLTPSTLDTWLGKLERRTVDVTMPRFRLETTYDMSQTLVSMGMKRAFTNPTQPDGAQFDGMGASQDPRMQLFISRVLHKAFVEVTERGTEAAAATAIAMETEPMMASVPFVPTFKADRPFVFFIRDPKSGSILFLGRVTAPTGA